MSETTREELQRLDRRIDEVDQRVSELAEMLAQSQLEEWRRMIDQLELQAHLGQMELRDQLRQPLADLRRSWEDARTTFEEISERTDEARDVLFESLDPAMTQVRTAFEQAVRRLREG